MSYGPAVTTTNDIKTLGLFYHGNWRRSLGWKAWRWPLPVAFDHAYSDFLRPTGRPLLLSTVVLRAVFRPCRVCHWSRSLPSRDGRWQTEVCTVFRTGIVFYSICWNESEASLEPPALRLDTIPTSNSRTGDTGRARIKPLFLQKACIIPLSGFFASLFWFFIM